MTILVLNAGSSTLKFALFDLDAGRDPIAAGTIEAPDFRAAAGQALSAVGGRSIEAVGHRVVHGGAAFRESVRIDGRVREALAGLSALAPLHNPPAIEGIAAVAEALPTVPQVAVFDTAYYSDLPPRAFVYPVPYAWWSDWGIRRFGFHGISHSWCAERGSELLGPRAGSRRFVTCHLGNGASATASRGATAVATTMGFTPMEGLMMGSRSGSVDPGILLAVERDHGVTAAALEDALNHGSGLLGVSGISSDFREVSDAAQSGHARARLALDIYADRVRASVGSLATALGGIDALVFTGGVGENAAPLRAAVCEGLAFMGLCLDPAANAACRPDADVATHESPASILVIHAREELVIARETRRVLTEVS